MKDIKDEVFLTAEFDEFLDGTKYSSSKQSESARTLTRETSISMIANGCDLFRIEISPTQSKFDEISDELKRLSQLNWRHEGKSGKRRVIKDFEHINIIRRVYNEATKAGMNDGYAIFPDHSNSALRIFLKKGSNDHIHPPKISIQLNFNSQSIISTANLRKFIRSLLGSSVFDELESAKVCRFDCSYDISGGCFENLFFISRTKRNINGFKSDSGGLITLYMGEAEGNQEVAYNKKYEIERMQSKKDSRIIGKKAIRQVPTDNMMRIEVRRKNIKSLAAAIDEFQDTKKFDLQIYSSTGITHLNKSFMMSALAFGLQTALSVFPANEKLKLKNSLSNHKLDLRPIPYDIEFTSNMIRMLFGSSYKMTKSFREKYSESQQQYLHNGVVTNHLLELTGINYEGANKKQKKLIEKKLGGNISAGDAITLKDAMKLIAYKQ